MGLGFRVLGFRVWGFKGLGVRVFEFAAGQHKPSTPKRLKTLRLNPRSKLQQPSPEDSLCPNNGSYKDLL